MTTETASLPAFRAYGIELEYMIVDADDLSVKPIADQWLAQMAGSERANAIERGMLGWSNEMVLHVIELKNLRPSTMLQVLPTALQAEIQATNRSLAGFGARLMPGAMHPWMNPQRDTRLWPHQQADIYRAFDRIFDAHAHGWANLQSMQINLPFGNDQEFAHLHAAVRAVLPILPALAASSPIADAKRSGYCDTRMQAYRHNAAAIPAITGRVIPDTFTNRDSYRTLVLDPIYRDIEPHDPELLLRHEWLNARGAIPRFERNAIEIRVIDMQECPKADLAIAAATISVVKALHMEEWASLAAQQSLPTAMLVNILHDCIREADQAVIRDAAYLRLFGMPDAPCRAGELWQFLIEERLRGHACGSMAWQDTLLTLVREGPLARRILRALGGDAAPGNMSPDLLREVYRRLCDCLDEGSLFLP